MAKREPLFEADLGDNGGLVRLCDAQDVERFIAEEQSFWRVIHEGDMSTPFNVVHIQMGEALRSAVEKRVKTRETLTCRVLPCSDEPHPP